MKVSPFLLLALFLAPALDAAPQNAVRAKSAAPARSAYHAEFLASLAEVEDKLVRLAEATPPEKFTWRPARDVRSISEVYMHVAGANYFLCTFVGVEAPEASQDLEKRVTKKAQVITELKRSFDHLRSASASVTDLEKRVKLFGSSTSHRGVLSSILQHVYEHLGQSIAYARMNGVTPPWSR